MKKHTLAKELRKRQIAGRYNPRHVALKASDAEIIDCYNRCCQCNRELLPDVTAYETVDQFIGAINKALENHQHA